MKVNLITLVVWTIVLGFAEAESGKNETLKGRWETFLQTKNECKSKANFSRIFFMKESDSWTSQEMREILREVDLTDLKFCADLGSSIVEKSVSNNDFATVQLCLEKIPLSHVWDQRLDYYLVTRKNKLYFYLLFSAYSNSLEQSLLVTKSLRSCICMAFPEAELEREKTAKDFLTKAKKQYELIKNKLALDPDQTQVSIPLMHMNYGLLDFAKDDLYKLKRIGNQPKPKEQ